MTADVQRELAVALRGELALWLSENTGTPDGDSWGMWPLDLRTTADALLAGPLAPLLAKLRAVEVLAAKVRAYPPSAVPLGMLLRALDGGEQ